nr:hydrogenase nickel incorporation protein HypB [Bacteroidota bacterium]
MCGTCGCGQSDESYKIIKPGEEEHSHHYHHHHDHTHDDEMHSHEHKHAYAHRHDHDDHGHTHEHSHGADDHSHQHAHGHAHSREIIVEQNALQKNDLLAERNRGYFEAKGVLAINLVSSPGSGKTTLLEKTIQLTKDQINLYVIEGDQQTMQDANRINNAGAPVVQINTGNGCHLDATMVSKACKQLNIDKKGILIIENVGNLVCPSLFDLGEAKRVVIMSVTEGDDKPLKYPTMFETSDICVINKIDLLPYVDFDVEKSKEFASRINPNLKFFEVSAKSEEGLADWVDWLKNELKLVG